MLTSYAAVIFSIRGEAAAFFERISQCRSQGGWTACSPIRNGFRHGNGNEHEATRKRRENANFR